MLSTLDMWISAPATRDVERQEGPNKSKVIVMAVQYRAASFVASKYKLNTVCT